MSTHDRHSALLRQGSLMRVQAQAGSEVSCLRGMLWLTQEHDPVDRILTAGERFVFDRTGVALLNALAHDAVVEYPAAIVCTITRAQPANSGREDSLAASIGRIGPRYDPTKLRTLPPGTRRIAVEREARRMRAQACWLLIAHARRRVAQGLNDLSTRLRSALAQALRALTGKRRRASANG